MKFQPVIKWSGSKRSQSEEIINRIKDMNMILIMNLSVAGAQFYFNFYIVIRSLKNIYVAT